MSSVIFEASISLTLNPNKGIPSPPKKLQFNTHHDAKDFNKILFIAYTTMPGEMSEDILYDLCQKHKMLGQSQQTHIKLMGKMLEYYIYILAKPLGVWPPYLEDLTEDMIRSLKQQWKLCASGLRQQVVWFRVTPWELTVQPSSFPWSTLEPSRNSSSL